MLWILAFILYILEIHWKSSAEKYKDYFFREVLFVLMKGENPEAGRTLGDSQ